MSKKFYSKCADHDHDKAVYCCGQQVPKGQYSWFLDHDVHGNAMTVVRICLLQ